MVKDHLGKEYQTVAIMCDTYGIKVGTYRSRLHMGWTLKETLEGKSQKGIKTVPEELRTDHTGRVFRSIGDMCKFWNVPVHTFQKRRYKGLSIEQCLYSGNDRLIVSKGCFDHKGNSFVSKAAMCRNYNISSLTFRSRMSSGWSLEKALTTPVSEERITSLPEEYRTDHNGIVYSSIAKMCEKYGIATCVYNTRIKLGWDKERALTQKPDSKKKRQKHEPISIEDRTDHHGKVFDTKSKMLNYYKVDPSTYGKLLLKGETKEEILSRYEKKLSIIKSDDFRTDHKGKLYKSMKEMCKAYNTDVTVYQKRIEAGWDKEKALLTPKLNQDLGVTVEGKYWKSTKEACMHYNVSYGRYKSRIGLGWTPEEALEIKFRIPTNNSNFCKDIKIIKLIFQNEKNDFYLCLNNNIEEVLSDEELVRINRESKEIS